DPARLKVILQRALEKKRTEHEMHVLRRRLGQVDSAGVGIVGASPAMRKVMDLVEKVAPSKASVVITGQSGTGKEMVARAIHQLSPRKDKPFIAINCSAIPAGLMESEMFGHERGPFAGADQRGLGSGELGGARTSRFSCSISSTASAAKAESVCKASHRRRSRCSRTTPGRETSAGSATRSSAA